MGTFQRVVWYFVIQKMTKLRDGPLLSQSTTQNLMEGKYFPKYETTERKSVRQVWSKGDYLVMRRSLHTRFPRLSVILPKTSNPARTSWGGILEES